MGLLEKLRKAVNDIPGVAAHPKKKGSYVLESVAVLATRSDSYRNQVMPAWACHHSLNFDVGGDPCLPKGFDHLDALEKVGGVIRELGVEDCVNVIIVTRDVIENPDGTINPERHRFLEEQFPGQKFNFSDGQSEVRITRKGERPIPWAKAGQLSPPPRRITTFHSSSSVVGSD